MIEVICLFALEPDCFYSFCCWFLFLEFSSFGLGLKDFVFLFAVLYMRIVCGHFCLLESACTPLTNLSLWNKIWCGFHWFFFLFCLFSLCSISLVLFLCFLWLFRIFPTMCASLIDGTREWLLDAVKTWCPNLEEESRFSDFSCNCCLMRKIVWHRCYWRMMEAEHGWKSKGEVKHG